MAIAMNCDGLRSLRAKMTAIIVKTLQFLSHQNVLVIYYTMSGKHGVIKNTMKVVSTYNLMFWVR